MASQDTEITLGTAKLLGLFFGLVAVCAVFFALGYTLGRKSEVGLAATGGVTAPQTLSNASKPASSPPSQPMTFYKSVEQKDANSLPSADTTANSGAQTASDSSSSAPSSNTSLPDPMSALPGASYFVQVAAVSKQEDAEALVDALKKKQYPAFIAATSSADKLFHVQVGPFSDGKEAEGMRTRLINDGYSPILKK
jgi:DedD protein